MLTPEQLMQLAAGYDPFPILKQLSEGGITGGAGNETGAFDSSDNPWAGMTQPTTAGPKTPAPIDPRSMMALNSMLPQPPKPQFIGAPAPRAPGQVNMQAPDISAMIRASMASPPQTTGPATLAQLIGGR